MLDASIIATGPIGFIALGIIATLVVAISKAGFGGAMGSLSLPIMLIVLPPGLALIGHVADFSSVRFLCRLEILSPRHSSISCC